MKYLKLLHIFLITILISACSPTIVPRPISYGLGTSALGAGAGALTGAIISNGDVAMSTALGAGIGLGTGMLIGYAVDKREEMEARRIERDIESNREVIDARQREIDLIYENSADSSQNGEINSALTPTRIYNGPTLGNAYR